MNNRETLIHIITSLLCYKKYSESTGTKLGNEEMGILLESYRMALFPHVSEIFVKKIFDEVIVADKRMSDLGNKMVKYYDTMEEVQR